MQNSPIHKVLFWVAIIIFQMEDSELYGDAVTLMERNLRTLEANGAFEHEVGLLESGRE